MISFLIFYHDKDERFLKGCIESLPKGEEIILVETKQTGLPHPQMSIKDEHGKIKRYLYTYPELNFAEMRNYGIELCSQEWIFNIDPDERLLTHQHEAIMTLLHNINPIVGGIKIRIYSFTPYLEISDTDVVGAFRLIRNRGIKYSWAVHEDIVESINETGFKLIDSDILIHHLGYQVSEKRQLEKHERNKIIMENSGLLESKDPTILNRYTGYYEYSKHCLNKCKGVQNGSSEIS